MGMVKTLTPQEMRQVEQDYYRKAEDEIRNRHYIKIRVSHDGHQWNAVVPVSASFLSRHYSYTEWQEKILQVYREFSGLDVTKLHQSGEVSEDEANAWWMDRDTYGRPIPEADRPSPEDCF